jgi:hypothetical protein
MEAFEERLSAGNAIFYAFSHLVADSEGRVLVACFGSRPLYNPVVDYVPPKTSQPKDRAKRLQFNQKKRKEKKIRQVCEHALLGTLSSNQLLSGTASVALPR